MLVMLCPSSSAALATRCAPVLICSQGEQNAKPENVQELSLPREKIGEAYFF